ncbi:MAG: hypothetical protein ACREGH_02345 [Minisyncoccia bacterium]
MDEKEDAEEEGLPLEAIDSPPGPGRTEMQEAAGIHIGVWVLIVLVIGGFLAAFFAYMV